MQAIGINYNPCVISVSPRGLDVTAAGINIQPNVIEVLGEGLAIWPWAINIQPALVYVNPWGADIRYSFCYVFSLSTAPKPLVDNCQNRPACVRSDRLACPLPTCSTSC